MTVCVDCDADLAHCHGALVEHADFTVECTEDGCEATLSVHGLIVRCSDVEPACGCDAERAPASDAERGRQHAAREALATSSSRAARSEPQRATQSEADSTVI